MTTIVSQNPFPSDSSIFVRLSQVFWLSGRKRFTVFPPSVASTVTGQWAIVKSLAEYSGGSATDLHRVPVCVNRFAGSSTGEREECQVLSPKKNWYLWRRSEARYSISIGMSAIRRISLPLFLEEPSNIC
jgi:hypothetical protein